MNSIPATHLKNRLGEALRMAALGPVAVMRHGKLAAWLMPPSAVDGVGAAGRVPGKVGANRRPFWNRNVEAKVIKLVAGGDLRPSRWMRAGDPRVLSGVAVLLAGLPEFDRNRLLGLAERLKPGISNPVEFGQWLTGMPIEPARFVPMLRAALAAKKVA